MDINTVIQEFDEVVSKPGGVIGNTLRPGQIKTCRNILNAFKSNRRFVFVEAPTGSGKSMIALALSVAFKRAELRSMITVPTRELQRQMIKDVRDSEVRVMLGMSNFPCLMVHDETRGEKTKQGKQTDIIRANESTCHNAEGKLATQFLRSHDYIEESEGLMTELLPPPHPHQLIMPVVYSANVKISKMEEIIGKGNIKNKHLKAMCRNAQSCPYYYSRDEALLADITVMSLHGYIAYNHFLDFLEMFGPREFQSFDECHRMDGILRSFYTISRAESDLQKLYGETLREGESLIFEKMKAQPKDGWTDENVISVSRRLYYIVERAVQGVYTRYGCKDREEFVASLKAGLIDIDSDEEATQIFKDFSNLKTALADVNKKKNKEYLLGMKRVQTRMGRKYIEENALIILPVALPEDIEKFWGTYNLFMTATMLPFDIMKKMYRVPDELAYYEKVPDSFPVENRPIFLDYIEKMTEGRYREIGAVSVKRENYDSDKAYLSDCRSAGYKQVLARMAEKLREIADAFPGESGLVFVNGYGTAKDIGELLAKDKRFVAATNTAENVSAIREHKEKIDGGGSGWLISAGTKEGYDFIGKYCRIQVFAKVPYPPMDRFMEAVNKLYRGYYASSVVQTLRQQYGRGMRDPKDFCATIVLDSMFDKVINDPTYSRSLPTEFLKAIQKDKKWQDASIDSEKISY